MTEKKISIGFDLDGVIIDKPPFVPKKVLEWLVRSHKNKKLAYRFPTCLFERWLRWLSHHPLLRPPIKKNLKLVREISKNKKYKLYLISSRYNFLKGRTKQWLESYGLNGIFQSINLNLKNEQPHLFKKKTIRKLSVDIFIDDDLPLVKYLKREIKKTKIIHIQKFNKEFKKIL